ncbi:ATP-binding protein [Corallococcus sp. AB011P]|uniref:ATP-binding protein n=1 Tax=Corallococcus sp. AB011P TaxID=2316735 RepID=UPI000EA183AD|nr:ATP-binding protein [Corallococcus sp. AB011P]RKG61236.1 ATP-binding protein [Corallococcus sp. AB011P]
MTDGISALEGFDYQAMTALELMLEHFKAHGPTARARPEGIEDLDLEYRDDQGLVHRILIQIKKPRQNAAGSRTPTPWTLSGALEALLSPRWNEIQKANTQVWWVLGDSLGDDVKALLGSSDNTTVWAARRAAAEWVVREQRASAQAKGTAKIQVWESPFRAGARPEGSIDDAQKKWTDSFVRRASQAGFDATTITSMQKTIARAHIILEQSLQRVACRAPFADADELRARLTTYLSAQLGLNELDVRDVVFRNLRGFIDDVARSRGKWIDHPALEGEILRVWPRRIATVLPPPLPKPHLLRPAWTRALAKQTGAVVGPSGAGKTTSATELFHKLRETEPDTAVLYAEVRNDTTWQGVLEGVAYALGRRGETAPYKLLPSLRDGDDKALIDLADELEAYATPVALLVDLIDGTASKKFIRDLARFAQRFPAAPKTRLWVFGQEDALAELSNTERATRHLPCVSIPGFAWEEFLDLAQLHRFKTQSTLHSVYEALASGRTAGVPPRVADAVLRLGTVESALKAAMSSDVLLAADTTRYEGLSPRAQEALGALACIAHPFQEDDAETTFPSVAVKAGIRAGTSVGLLHSLGDGRFEFHETVRRNILAQLPRSTQIAHHARLADVNAQRGDHVLESHHAEAAGLVARAREAGRTAFFDWHTADRIAQRAVARNWVSPAETLSLLRNAPKHSSGWWLALHRGIDDITAQGLLNWWREEVRHQGPSNALWSVPRALLASRPDLLLDLLNIAARSPQEDGQHHGAVALGLACRNGELNEEAVLERFENASADDRQVLADTLRYIGTPKCLARWLAYVIETKKEPTLHASLSPLSEAHVLAIVDALPDLEPAALMVRNDWGFGTATPFLWMHHKAIGEGAVRLLQDTGLAPQRAAVAIRLLGLTGRDELLDSSRRWGRHPSNAQDVALTAPLLVNADAWREELSRLAVDPSVDALTQVNAYGIYAQSGEGGELLLEKLVRMSPGLECACRWIAGMSFVSRPSLFALDILLEDFTRGGKGQVDLLSGSALMRASYFADGPHAKAVAERLVPLLDNHSNNIRIATLHVLTMLRQPIAREACVRLARLEAGNPIGSMAAIAASSSRPEQLSDVREAIEANPSSCWMLSTLAARLNDTGVTSYLITEAKDALRPWTARRRALQALERLPYTPEIDITVDCILKEQLLLGRTDSFDGQASTTILELMQIHTGYFIKLLQQDKEHFVRKLTSDIQARFTLQNIDTCLRLIWHTVRVEVSGGSSFKKAVNSVINRIQTSQVQSAALRVARTFNKVDILERTLATSDAPWIVVRALVERTNAEPRTPIDAAHWAQLVSDGPCGANLSLRIALGNVLEPFRSSDRRPRSPIVMRNSSPQILTAIDLHALLDKMQPAPPDARIADMDDASLTSLIDRLDFKDDDIVELDKNTNDAARVSLTINGATLNGPRKRSTGRTGNRPGIRARLTARFPERVPTAWMNSPLRGYGFISSLIEALANEGNPKRALAILRPLSGDITDIIGPRSNIYRLGHIADDALVNWLNSFAGVGGGAEVAALASFASQVSADAVLPLLWRLMCRIKGRISGHNATTFRGVDDPWQRAFVNILHAKRLRDVSGAGEWLVMMTMQTPRSVVRETIIEAMASFPSTWSIVEAEAQQGSDYTHRPKPVFLLAEEVAHALFRKIRDN